MNLKLAIPAVVLACLSLVMLVRSVSAQAGTGPVPSPYAGLKNPYPWNDPAAQSTGKQVYQLQCSGCHGTTGNGVANTDFSQPGFSSSLETKPDFYFWIFSEGNLAQGMPGYKTILSEQQRWSVLTYLWSLSVTPVVVPPSVPPTPGPAAGTISLIVPAQAPAGQPINIKAYLLDTNSSPVAYAVVTFFTMEDFYAKVEMEVGDATTDNNGLAEFSFTLRITGDTQVIARSGAVADAEPLTVTDGHEPYYHTKAGLKLPTIGKEVFIGPPSSRELDANADAPSSALRLPGGVLSWLLLPVAGVILAWMTCFLALFQVSRIPVVGDNQNMNLRLVPIIGMCLVILLGTVFVLMLITGPFTNFQLLP